MKNKKRNKILLLFILLVVVSVGYALLSTTLNISGSSTIAGNKWSIYWSNPQVTTGSITTALPVIEEDEDDPENTKITWSTTLNLPGDFYEFTVDATNNGTIDAMIEDIEHTVTPALPGYIKYEVTYADGTAIRPNDLLAKKTNDTPTTQKYKVRVEFLDTVTPAELDQIPEGGMSYTFTEEIIYKQANN